MRRLNWGFLGAVWLSIVGLGCSGAVGKNPAKGAGGASDGGDAGVAADGGIFGNATGANGKKKSDGGPKDAQVTVDAFFVNDLPPPMCGQDGTMQAATAPGGTMECPDDKNREGCPCSQKDMSVACWPGKRINRNHGQCKDGKTTCVSSAEFGLRWGPCEGYVLPNPDAGAGPAACRCFSTGTWKLSNLAPCIFRGGATYLYSSKLTSAGQIDCGTNVPEPPPAPPGSWTDDSLTVDCGGQFKLCYTIKAGNVDSPKADDCVVMQSCIDVWYPQAGMEQKLPDLPSWTSANTACSAKFDQGGGYGEMSVIGKSIECDAVDDGAGHPYVFHRTDYCPPSCQMTPNAPGCAGCQTGGSGMFGQ